MVMYMHTQRNDTMTLKPLDIDAIMQDEMFITPYTDSCYNESEVVDIFDDLHGDDYADAILADLGNIN